jgi:hypothetical protein
MFLTTMFVELRVVAGRSRTRTGSPQAISRQPCCTVTLRRTACSEHGMGAAWPWYGICESDTAAFCKSNGKAHSELLAARHGRGTAWARYVMCESAFRVGRQLSEEVRVMSGVSQGSVLGPLLFFVHLNDVWRNLMLTVGLFVEEWRLYNL